MLYNWSEYIYQINNDNIDCWMLLITWCDPYIHEYISPVDLVEDALSHIWWPSIDRCDMVADISWAAPWAFLRIDWAWNCVEFIDPATVFSSYNTDEMVSVDWTDPAWHLEDKIISSDSSILINNMWWQLDLTSNTINNFLWLSDTPSSYSGQDWNLLAVSWWSIVFIENDRSQRCTRMLADDQVLTQPPNVDQRHALQVSYAEWLDAMKTSVWGIPSITIQKTGMYRVWMNGGFHVNAWVNAAKLAVISTESWDKKLLLNSKTGTFPAWHPIVLTDLWETHRFFAFSESSLVKLTAGTQLFFMCRISSNNPTGTNWEVVIEGKSLVWGYPGSWSTEVYSNKYCWSLFWVSFYSNETHDAV